MSIYCGGNLNDSKLTNGTHTLGTNYTCLRKGIGVGKYVLPPDPKYGNIYNPVDKRKFYCGTKSGIPDGYFARGSPSMCFRKGVGVGKKLKVLKGKKKKGKKGKDESSIKTINRAKWLKKCNYNCNNRCNKKYKNKYKKECKKECKKKCNNKVNFSFSFNGKKKNNFLSIYHLCIYIFTCIYIFIIMYIVKPSFIRDKKDKKNKKINWKYFILYYIGICIICIVLQILLLNSCVSLPKKSD